MFEVEEAGCAVSVWGLEAALLAVLQAISKEIEQIASACMSRIENLPAHHQNNVEPGALARVFGGLR